MSMVVALEEVHDYSQLVIRVLFVVFVVFVVVNEMDSLYDLPFSVPSTFSKYFRSRLSWSFHISLGSHLIVKQFFRFYWLVYFLLQLPEFLSNFSLFGVVT